MSLVQGREVSFFKSSITFNNYKNDIERLTLKSSTFHRKSMLKSFESKGLNFVRKHRGVVQDETGPALTIPVNSNPALTDVILNYIYIYIYIIYIQNSNVLCIYVYIVINHEKVYYTSMVINVHHWFSHLSRGPSKKKMKVPSGIE